MSDGEPETHAAKARDRSKFGSGGIMGCDATEPALDSWSAFVGEFALDAAPSWIFRGQSDSAWGLGTSLQRAFAAVGVSDPVDRAHRENSSIGFFKDRARRHLPDTPTESDLLGWLALMQHYGAPTRLQDWTSSPFIAAYFAYREARETDAAIWAVQAYFCRRAVTPGAIGLAWDHLGVFEEVYLDPSTGDEVPVVRSLLTTQAEHENELLRDAIRRGKRWPLPVVPFNLDDRMAAQQAAFLVATSLDFPVDALLQKTRWPPQAKPGPFAADLAGRVGAYPLTDPHQVIKRVLLPRAWRNQALHTLARMGITEDTMFPGMDGAGRATANQIAAGEVALRDALNTTA